MRSPLRPADPLVTVIIATFNRSAALRHAITSVLVQDLADFEVIVVGDSCTDDSEAVTRAFGDARLRWLNLSANSGSQAAPNNAGLRAARGRYVAYLGHDDLWFPWHLSTLARGLEQQNADFAHSLCALLGPEGVVQAIGPPRPNVTYKQHFVPPSVWLHRRDLVQTCGLWRDPDRLPWPVDLDYSRHLFLSGCQFTFCPRLTALKFPSARFPGSYRWSEAEPQQRHLDAMRADAGRLERDVLLTLAVEYARERRGGYEPAAAAFVRALRVAVYWALEWWGRDRGPLDTLMRRRFQRRRAVLRVVRGLDPQTGPATLPPRQEPGHKSLGQSHRQP